ncbi:HAMP domain-containing histidine kinase [Spirulina subsalsa FACHB-351]|uniref:histidine kinase n=1 Tax=Spirulina subsalsa FACHB-351 TaxID=234711 RepID=A0ABT3LBK1_9CYAN|nr:HAMP domain-containing sensor histidine kinase [Spirulina subsalsa]MCW6038883.1 HAMP domain-containing histidine kinase [Spirulina subsalsa FACHB-351]
MVLSNWVLPTLYQVLTTHHPDHAIPRGGKPSGGSVLKAEAEWYGAIAALHQILLNLTETSPHDCVGVVLSGCAPVVSDSHLLSRLQTGIFTPKAFQDLASHQFQLPAAPGDVASVVLPTLVEYSLLPTDPLVDEQFCLVLTAEFGLVLALGETPSGDSHFQFSFDPHVVHQAWQALRSRLLLTSPQHIQPLDTLVGNFIPPIPDYRLVTQFSHHLLQHLPDFSALAQRCPSANTERSESKPSLDLPQPPPDIPASPSRGQGISELEILQALTHEVRTPLTTIRMLTRLLLKKRKHLGEEVTKRLEVIDQECTEQINRMELIFRAAELETQPPNPNHFHLIPISLHQVIEQNIPQWQKQAKRRNVQLEVLLPEQLPTVITNPSMLDQALSGLMECFTRTLPTGGQLRVKVTTAGHQLKLQLVSENVSFTSSLKSMGQLLMFQPETGSISLNLDVTKNLFQALGGKLTVRQRPQQGEVLTIFLPLGGAVRSYL